MDLKNAFIVIDIENRNRKNMLSHRPRQHGARLREREYMYAQELVRRLLQADHKVEQDGEHARGSERDRHVHERERDGLDEGVVQRGFALPEDDRALGEQGGDLGHARKRGEEEPAVTHMIRQNREEADSRVGRVRTRT